MKKFFEDFKKFITRGNVLDMAVGVIVGGAFNTIVTTLNQKILMPIVNWALSYIPGMESGLYYIMPNSKLAEVGMENPIVGPDGLNYAVLNYIDFTAFFESIINFLFIALTLFVIVRTMAYMARKRAELEEKFKKDDETQEIE